jgi:predicted RNA-binding protein (TIGR00451 family)
VSLEDALVRIRAVGDYQFGRGVGAKLFPDGVKISFSMRTGRIRYVFSGEKRIATMRPTDGLFSLSIEGANRITQKAPSAKCFVTIRDDVSKFIIEGGDVFAAHVIRADSEIRAKDEVIILDSSTKVLAVGRALLSGDEMKVFKRGVAIKVRRGCLDEG